MDVLGLERKFQAGIPSKGLVGILSFLIINSTLMESYMCVLCQAT